MSEALVIDYGVDRDADLHEPVRRGEKRDRHYHVARQYRDGCMGPFFAPELEEFESKRTVVRKASLALRVRENVGVSEDIQLAERGFLFGKISLVLLSIFSLLYFLFSGPIIYAFAALFSFVIGVLILSNDFLIKKAHDNAR